MRNAECQMRREKWRSIHYLRAMQSIPGKHWFLILLLCAACSQPAKKAKITKPKAHGQLLRNISYDGGATKSIHVFVALCDNKYQGIVPVPAKIGNGQDPGNNLYWGNDYGVRTFFKRSKDWKLIETRKTTGTILERLVFKNTEKNYYLVADAYDGRYIKQTTKDFLHSCSGQLKDTLHADNKTIGLNGNAGLLAYIGHDGMMDFRLTDTIENTDGKIRDCIILACISKTYFSPFIKASKSYPLVWTTGLMCPEAYTLHDAVNAYVNGEPKEQVRASAVAAYKKYQKFGAGTDKLLVSGW